MGEGRGGRGEGEEEGGGSRGGRGEKKGQERRGRRRRERRRREEDREKRTRRESPERGLVFFLYFLFVFPRHFGGLHFADGCLGLFPPTEKTDSRLGPDMKERTTLLVTSSLSLLRTLVSSKLFICTDWGLEKDRKTRVP